MYHVHVYPDLQDPVPHTEIFEVIDEERDTETATGAEVREHPEVPLTEAQRDAVVRRLGYRRAGPWTGTEDRVEALVECAPDVPGRR